MTISLDGFDPEYADLRDYILKITWRIWEEGGIERIRDYYAPETPVKTPGGETHTAEQVIASTRATLADFPDRQLYGEDVVGSEDAAGRYYSSHRILSAMTHTGDSPVFGPATGKKLSVRTTADCVCERGRVVDEWMVRDRGALAIQLGLDPLELARSERERAGGTKKPDELIERWACGVHDPSGKDPQDLTGAAARHAAALAQLTCGKLELLAESHDRACSVWFPYAHCAGGRDAAAACWREHAGALPAKQFRVHHAIDELEPDYCRRTALRWSCLAQHADGCFGPGTGREAAVLGISHAEWRGEAIVREWHLWDAIAIQEQLI